MSCFLNPFNGLKKETARLWQQKLDQFLEPFHEQSLYFIQHKQALMVGMLYTFIQLGFFFIIFFCVSSIFDPHVSFY